MPANLIEMPASSAPGGDALPSDTQNDWGIATRIAFRFFFALFLLLDLPFPLNVAPPVARLLQPYDAMWAAIVAFAGRHFFALQNIAHADNGSGDRTYDYVLLFCQIAIALIVTVLWSALSRRREYRTLHGWLRVYVRFFLGATMLQYGAFKVIPAQFTAPSPYRLTETFGEASPMGLLWAFMGASMAYTIFAGLSEVSGGILLMFRRTTLLGALVSMAVLLNVVMLNFSYDVAVKIFSTELLVHAGFLIVPELRRLFDFFVLQRPTTPRAEPRLFASPALRRAAPLLATAFFLAAIGFPLQAAYQQRERLLKRGPLHGAWNVEMFSADGSLPAALTDVQRWKTIIVQGGGASIQTMDGTRRRFALTVDERKRTFTLAPRDKPAIKYSLAYTTIKPDGLELSGVFEDRKLDVKLRSVDLSKLLLVSRGFHWINEEPFNR